MNNKKLNVDTGYLTTREIVSDVLNSSKNQFYSISKYEPIVEATKDIPLSARDQARKAILLDEKIDSASIGTKNSLTARILISA